MGSTSFISLPFFDKFENQSMIPTILNKTQFENLIAVEPYSGLTVNYAQAY